jgi:hypothetical protein
MKVDFYEIEEAGEESGREECACDFPFLPRYTMMTSEEIKRYRRMLKRYGRGRAQGLYRLRGKAARVFSQSWAMGYLATRDVFEREGHIFHEEVNFI